MSQVLRLEWPSKPAAGERGERACPARRPPPDRGPGAAIARPASGSRDGSRSGGRTFGHGRGEGDESGMVGSYARIGSTPSDVRVAGRHNDALRAGTGRSPAAHQKICKAKLPSQGRATRVSPGARADSPFLSPLLAARRRRRPLHARQPATAARRRACRRTSSTPGRADRAVSRSVAGTGADGVDLSARSRRGRALRQSKHGAQGRRDREGGRGRRPGIRP